MLIRILTMPDIYWLAGLLEGEGCFTTQGASRMKLKLALVMNDLDIMQRAAVLLGGHVGPRQRQNPRHHQSYQIQLYGHLAAGWMMTLYLLLGERRRKRIRTLLTEWKEQPTFNKWKMRCKRGHEFDLSLRSKQADRQRLCTICRREQNRLGSIRRLDKVTATKVS